MIGLVTNLRVGSSTFRLSIGVRFGDVSGPRSDDWAGVAGRVGRGLRGGGVRRPPNQPPLEGGVGKKYFLIRREVASGLDFPAEDLLDLVVADECLPTLSVGDEDYFHKPFRRGEDMYGIVGLFMCGDKPHVPRRDPDKVRHVVVAANCCRVPRCVLPDS